MSLVSNEQQEIIDNVISSYIKTHDNIAQQYLKLRQDIFLVSSQVVDQVQRNGKADVETHFKLQQLELENDKMNHTYAAYVKRLVHSLEFNQNNQPQYLQGLEKLYNELTEKKNDVKTDVDQLREVKKPVVEKMKQLASKFDSGVTVKIGGKLKPPVKVMSSKDAENDPNSVLLDFSSSVFEKTELRAMFGEVDTKLRQLKTVDEVNDPSDTSKPNSEQTHSINIIKYMDELLQNSRAYTHLDDTKYAYDISKSTSVDAGSASMVLDDYGQAIQALTTDIKDLVARGADAKERWISNAKKLETVQAVLQGFDDDMDED